VHNKVTVLLKSTYYHKNSNWLKDKMVIIVQIGVIFTHVINPRLFEDVFMTKKEGGSVFDPPSQVL